MPVARCSSNTANAVAFRLLSFLSGFVVNCLLYQLSIHNTTHCWCILFHVVCNLTAAFFFSEGALYRARPDLAKMRRCALLPSTATTDFGFPLVWNCAVAHQQIKAPGVLYQNTNPSLAFCRNRLFNAATRPFIFAHSQKKHKQQSRALVPLF